MSKLKINVSTLSKDFEFENKEMSFDVSEYNEKEQQVFYSFKMPDHVYNELLDTAPEYTVEKGFKKTLKSPMIKIIIEKYFDLCNEIVSRKSLKNETREKKIFVSFKHKDSHERCEWTGGYMGHRVSSAFQFFIGYKIMEEKGLTFAGETPKMTAAYYTLICHKNRQNATVTRGDTNFEEGTELHPLHMKHERELFEKTYAILDWSQEAEDFLRNVQNKFAELNEHLNSFLGNMSNEKLQHLMQNSTELKMLNK